MAQLSLDAVQRLRRRPVRALDETHVQVLAQDIVSPPRETYKSPLVKCARRGLCEA
jgi:hypothetical protein